MTTLVGVGRAPLYPMPGWLPPRPRPRPPVRPLRSAVPIVSMFLPRDSQPTRLATSKGVTLASVVPTGPTGEGLGCRSDPTMGQVETEGRPTAADA